MKRLLLEPGTYRAMSDVVVALFRGDEQLEYQVIEAGQDFAVLKPLPGFSHYAIYDGDTDEAPMYERIGD